MAVVVFRSEDNERIGSGYFLPVFPQTRRRVVTVMQAFFHDREVVFEQIQQFCFRLFSLLQSRQDETRDLIALAVASSGSGDDGDVILRDVIVSLCYSSEEKRLSPLRIEKAGERKKLLVMPEWGG